MTRRKKRPKQNQRIPTSTSNSASPMLDKSLPSLPVDNEAVRLGSNSTTPTELSARPRPQTKPNSLKSNTTPDQLSPVAFQPSSGIIFYS